MNFIFDHGPNNPLVAKHGFGAVFNAPPEGGEEINVEDKIAKEGIIHATMPHGIAVAANVLEGIEEFRASTQDTRTVIVANPDPGQWMDPSANFKPS